MENIDKLSQNDNNSTFEKILKMTDTDKMLELINNDSVFKKEIYEKITNINLSYLSPYEKYWVNMRSLQDRLVELWFDLWNFWTNKNWVDWTFWPYTFLAIINLQKAIWQNPTWIANTDLLKFLFPYTFRTLNKNEWRSQEDT